MTAQERLSMSQQEQKILNYSIPRSLYNERPFQFEISDEEPYRLSVKSIDIGTMLADVRHRTSRNTIYAIDEVNKSPILHFSDEYSFFNLPKSRKHFTGVLGAVKFTGQIEPEFVEFYQHNNIDRRRLTRDTRGQINNRGGNYFIAIDSTYSTPFEKISLMRQDINSAAKVLEKVDRNTIETSEKFLQYIGVLDYLKQHSLCFFHAVTYPERFSNFSADEEYEVMKSTMWDVTRTFTRTYYQALYGLPYDDFDISQQVNNINQMMDNFISKNPQMNQFKLQEIDHPLILSLAAYQTVKTFPSVEHLICLPSGGTQFGIATELMYEYISKANENDFIPELSSLVISTHAGRRGNGNLLGRDDLVMRLKEFPIAGKDTLLLDDNSNTGLTLQIVKDALSEVGVHSVHASLAELDPLRILYKQTDIDPPEHVANLLHSDFNSAASITPIVVFEGSRDMQLRKIVAESIVKRV